MSEGIESLLKKVIVMLVVFGPLAAWVHYSDTRIEYVCYERATVVEIVEVGYRSSKVLMSNGEIMEFGQPKTPVRVGNEYCTRGSNERNDLPNPWYLFWK